MQPALNLVPDTHDIQTKSLMVSEDADTLVVSSQASFNQGSEMLLTIKDFLKKIKKTFDPIKKRARATWQETIDQEKHHQAPLLKAEATIKAKLATYSKEQEKKRLAEEKKLQEEQRKQAEEAKLDQALEAEKQGNKEVAEQILSQPVITPAAVLPKAVPQPKGIITRKVWKFKIDNPSLIPNEYKKIDEVAIGKVVRAMGERTNIPGVLVYEEHSIAAGRRS